MGQEPDQIREQIEETRSQMGETVEALGHKADVPGRIKENLADKRDRLRDQMAGAGSRLNEATPDASDAKQGAQRAVGVAQENPLGLALGGVAVGFLAGMALPATRVEEERIGPVASEVKDRALEAGQEAVERGKTVAQDAAEAATEAARESGSEQAGELRDSAQESVEQMRS